MIDSAGSDRRFSRCAVREVRLADAVSAPTAQRGGRYRLGHRPVGFDERRGNGGIEPGSMYSQAYVSVDGRVAETQA